MGWDAFATKDGRELDTLDTNDYSIIFADTELAAVFAQADAVFKGIMGRGSSLRDGQLRGTTRFILEAATFEPCYRACICWGRIDWSSDAAARLSERADWSNARWCLRGWHYLNGGPEDFWDDYWSSKLFLQTCAAHGLGIRFSW